MAGRRSWVAWVGATAMTLCADARASDQPYCGVYCAYAALQLCGSAVELRELLDTKYVPSRLGSTVNDLAHGPNSVLGLIPNSAWTNAPTTCLI
jgi:hypothetical protein